MKSLVKFLCLMLVATPAFAQVSGETVLATINSYADFKQKVGTFKSAADFARQGGEFKIDMSTGAGDDCNQPGTLSVKAVGSVVVVSAKPNDSKDSSVPPMAGIADFTVPADEMSPGEGHFFIGKLGDDLFIVGSGEASPSALFTLTKDQVVVREIAEGGKSTKNVCVYSRLAP